MITQIFTFIELLFLSSTFCYYFVTPFLYISNPHAFGSYVIQVSIILDNHYLIAVSYTHLDVYKRQHMYSNVQVLSIVCHSIMAPFVVPSVIKILYQITSGNTQLADSVSILIVLLLCGL